MKTLEQLEDVVRFRSISLRELESIVPETFNKIVNDSELTDLKEQLKEEEKENEVNSEQAYFLRNTLDAVRKTMDNYCKSSLKSDLKEMIEDALIAIENCQADI